MRQAQKLDSAWRFKARDQHLSLNEDFAQNNGWFPATVPGSVLQNLLEAGQIPDPFYGQNELAVQWVGETDWLYQTQFSTTPLGPAEQALLCFDGLDTFAQVWLNGHLILQSENMFLPAEIDVSTWLKTENHLQILFQSAWQRGLELQAGHGGPKPLWNGDPSRLQVRKAQYHYGWDWGPKLIDAGPWRSIRLERSQVRIAEIHAPTTLKPDFSEAWIDLEIELKTAAEGTLEASELNVSLRDPNGLVIAQTRLVAKAKLSFRWRVADPELWFPHTLGAQPLYQLELELLGSEGLLDARSQSIGIRQIRVLQKPLLGQTGSSFTLEVNGVESFVGGANWIPDDNLLARIQPGRYRERITAAKQANMAMLRVWGGGIYEDDVFYQICDEQGLLVWQDFMFACGIYPGHTEFLENVKLEAIANIKRLRSHPCLALWTGNNEDYQLAHGLGRSDPATPPEQASQMPARMIYERLLPALLAELDPDRYYQPGSPFFGDDPDDPSIGDRHTWEVWGRDARPYRDYQKLGGRFVSEFGMAAAPNITTLKASLPESDWSPRSPGFLHHIKAGEGMMRLERYASAFGSIPEKLEDFVYATQLAQSEALDCAYRIWRRGWGHAGARTVSGALVWQLNDCWPVTAWALIDSAGRPKPAYHSVKRALEPITVNLWPGGDGASGAEVWAMNAGLQAKDLGLEWRAFSLDGQLIAQELRAVRLAANACTELGDVQVPGLAVLEARLWEGPTVIARAALFPEPFKDHPLPDPGLHLMRHGSQLHLGCQRPAKGVWIDVPGLSDNMIDLMPNEVRVLEAESIPQELAVRCLGAVQQFQLPELEGSKSQASEFQSSTTSSNSPR